MTVDIMGPGFFVFFQEDRGVPRTIPLFEARDEEIEEEGIIKILFSFLQNGDIK